MTYEIALSALADPTRRRIVEELGRGPCGVGELAEKFPISQPAISQHLKVLRRASLVSETPLGARRIYRVEPSGLEDLRTWIDRFWKDTLQTYKEAVERDVKR